MMISEQHKQILAVLADGRFHSGTELAKRLGLSRSAIWKQLNGLAELGLGYAAVSGKGYRLERPLELLAEPAILQHLRADAKALLAGLEIHEQIPSTNSYLMAQAQQQAAAGTVCFAEAQTGGKGRRGRQWISPYGHNIYLSILWRFQQGPAVLSGLSLAVGVAVIRALQELNLHPVALKWPNDIYSNGKKLGGILVEVSGETEGPCHAVIGLGLNIYLPVSEASAITQAWTDISSMQQTQAVGRNRLAAALLNQLLPVLAGYETQGFAAFAEEWRSHDGLRDKPAQLFIGNQCINGTVRGIDDNGLLLLEKPDGQVQAFASGEVSFSGDKP